MDVEGIPFGVAAAQFGPGFRRDMTEKAVSALMSSNKSALELYNASAGAFKVFQRRPACIFRAKNAAVVAYPSPMAPLAAKSSGDARPPALF